MSGGRDSTVVFEMALIVAKEKNRLPLKVFWLEQEAEEENQFKTCKRLISL